MIKRAAINFTLKAAGGAASVLVAALAARNMSTGDYGTLASLLSYCALLGGLLALGGDHFFKKYFGERSGQGLSRTLATALLLQVIVLSIFAGLGSMFFIDASLNRNLLVITCIALIAFIAWQKSCSGSLIGVGGANWDALVTGVFRPLTTLVLLAFLLFVGTSVDMQLVLDDVLGAQLAGFILSVVIALALIYKLSKSQSTIVNATNVLTDYQGTQGYLRYLRESVPFTVVGATGLLERNIDTLMLAAISGPESAGAYFIVTRLSVLAMMPLQAFNATNSRRFSRLLASSDLKALRETCFRVSLYSAGVVAIIFLVVLLAGPFILGFFGEAYRQEWVPLAILLASWAIRSLIGPANIIAVLSGNGDWAARAAASSLVANIVLNALLIPIAGIYGAVAATVLTRLCRSLAISRYLQKKLNVKIGIL